MKTGRKPKPTVLHRLHGTFHVTRHGARNEEPSPPTELAALAPPGDLTDLQRECWSTVVANVPPTMLRAIDASMLRGFVIAEALLIEANRMQAIIDRNSQLRLMVQGRHRGDILLSPYVKLQLKAALVMARIGAELGFSPTSRAGLMIDARQEDEDDRWDYLMRTAASTMPYTS
jgi:phage terminase small subunit